MITAQRDHRVSTRLSCSIAFAGVLARAATAHADPPAEQALGTIAIPAGAPVPVARPPSLHAGRVGLLATVGVDALDRNLEPVVGVTLAYRWRYLALGIDADAEPLPSLNSRIPPSFPSAPDGVLAPSRGFIAPLALGQLPLGRVRLELGGTVGFVVWNPGDRPVQLNAAARIVVGVDVAVLPYLDFVVRLVGTLPFDAFGGSPQSPDVSARLGIQLRLWP